MRLAQLSPSGIGAVVGDDAIVDVTAALTKDGLLPVGGTLVDVMERYDTLAEPLRRAAEGSQSTSLSFVRLAAPVPRPPKLWCAAGNYQRESSGMGEARGRGGASDMSLNELLEAVFLKPSTAVIGPGENVVIPEGFGSLFPEIELCVVIGKRCRNLSREEAMSAVFGYTVVLDMTARGPMWGKLMQGSRCIRKGFDTFAPLGPWIVTRDEIPDPQALTMRLLVNGDERQYARTEAMLNGVPELVSYLSKVCTLEPGDLIATGNPDHPDFQVELHPGDQMHAEIEGIGALEVGVAAA
ncbi:MAG: fumarylacetoacetate hydrolase family protein [Chloroflexi bacterium]|nr:fumarylacetoacetate hydrolase family protein [Chloroflexota bacterium]